VRDRIWKAYRIDSEIIHPPVTALPAPVPPPARLPERYALTVSRSRGYKNTHLIAQAKATGMWPIDLVIVGEGSSRFDERDAGVWGLGRVTDSELSYLYSNAECLIAVAYEDFGLTPLEANQAGTPVLALDAGGYRDTVAVGDTGLLIESPSERAIESGVNDILQANFSPQVMREHASRFSYEQFQINILSKIRSISAGVA
jgi:glycosyltransferase involved in cell wall biosynthesis